jgi:hypothetical protein
LFSIIPLSGMADHVVNGGFPFDLPVLQPFFVGAEGVIPTQDDFEPYTGFLDAQIRYGHVKNLLASVAGLDRSELLDDTIIPRDAVIREFTGGSTIQIPHNE